MAVELQSLWSGWRGRVLISALVLLVLVLVGSVGVLLANTHGASQVARNARELHWTNATKGAAGIARASLAQAVFFSFEDVSGSGDKDAALSEAFRNLAFVSNALGSESSNTTIDGALGDFVSSAEDILQMVEVGRSSVAEQMRLDLLEPQYEEFVSLLDARQADLMLAIADSERSAGQISRVTFVAIAFLIPAIVMLVFWFILRRRVRAHESQMLARLEAEKDLNLAKDELIAGLSHELRTPLTTIFGFSEILLDDSSIGDETRELLSLINASSVDLSRMVNDLLTAARLDAEALTTSLEQFDLANEVQAVAEPYVRSGEALTLKVPPLRVYSDPLHVRQIVHNLVSNALRHGGGDIVISGSKKKNRISLVVADNGPGIPEEMTNTLFRRFTHKGRQALVAGSVGLGLAISQELARTLGGGLRYSRIDGWTTFALTLPAVLTREDLHVTTGTVEAAVTL